MGKIDIDKFVASIMKCLCKPHREEAYLCRHWINKALDEAKKYVERRTLEYDKRNDSKVLKKKVVYQG